MRTSPPSMPSPRGVRWSTPLLPRCRRTPGFIFHGIRRCPTSRRSRMGPSSTMADRARPAWQARLGCLVALAVLLATEARSQTPAVPLAGVDAVLLEDIAVGSRVLAELGVLDGFGHVSARHPAKSDRFLMARSLAP